MGGYMGFGLQKWIYSRKPRTKMYVRNRLSSFTPLINYSRNFQLKPSIRENKLLNGILTIGILIFMVILMSLLIQKFTIYSKRQSEKIITMNGIENQKAFNFLINSGTNQLKQDNITGAYSEFLLAYEIYPNNEELYQLLIETLSILCEDDKVYCKDLDILMVSH